MKLSHKNLPFDVELYKTVPSNAGGDFYSFHPTEHPSISMSLCKNLKSEEEAIKFFNSIYDDTRWAGALTALIEKKAE